MCTVSNLHGYSVNNCNVNTLCKSVIDVLLSKICIMFNNLQSIAF